MTQRRLASLVVAVFVLLCTALSVRAGEGCRAEPVTEHTPSGLAGCVVYGEGTASMYGGPGIARNDCVWPWTSCTPITITSLETGLSITVTPTMFCDCWQLAGPNGETQRIVDLDPAAVAALGLDPSRGLWPVRVEPANDPGVGPVLLSSPVAAPAVIPPGALPDTAVAP